MQKERVYVYVFVVALVIFFLSFGIFQEIEEREGIRFAPGEEKTGASKLLETGNLVLLGGAVALLIILLIIHKKL